MTILVLISEANIGIDIITTIKETRDKNSILPLVISIIRKLKLATTYPNRELVLSDKKNANNVVKYTKKEAL
jgi:hypothetical protein